MPLPRAQSYPQTQEYARARTFRQLALVVAFTVLVVALVALSALADVTGFESTRAAKTRYAVVIDAGSTGTRVHVFTFSRSAFASGGEALRDETFRSIEPGLKSYGGDAEAAATSVEALIDVAKGVVPESARRETPFSVRATAGLRLMPEGREAADAIVEAVRRKIANAGFHPSSASFVKVRTSCACWPSMTVAASWRSMGMPSWARSQSTGACVLSVGHTVSSPPCWYRPTLPMMLGPALPLSRCRRHAKDPLS